MASGRGGSREGSGRKSGWKNADTQTIRVPKVFAAQLLEIARKLDSGEVIETVTESKAKPDETVTKSKYRPRAKPKPARQLSIDSITELEIQPLSGKALARRLGVSDTAVRKHRDGLTEGSIPEWTRLLDPAGITWEYREETKHYHPLIE